MYGIFVENLDCGGDTWCYLVIGPEKAMLVDTGEKYIVINHNTRADRVSAGYILNDDTFASCMRGSRALTNLLPTINLNTNPAVFSAGFFVTLNPSNNLK